MGLDIYVRVVREMKPDEIINGSNKLSYYEKREIALHEGLHSVVSFFELENGVPLYIDREDWNDFRESYPMKESFEDFNDNAYAMIEVLDMWFNGNHDDKYVEIEADW